MKKQQQWLAASLVALAIGSATLATAGDIEAEKCAAKLNEIDVAIEEARKEGSMRKVATLKDLRVEALRCANKAKAE
jgi:hypothetical protein